MANFNFNKVILGGRLTSDPEMKVTPTGTQVTSFRMAINRNYRGKSDDEPKVDFINVVAWRQTAEFICKFFRKGSSICIVGSLQVREWEAKDGTKRSTVEVVASEANFVDSRSESPAGKAEYNPYDISAEDAPKFEELSDEEPLPF